MLAAFGDFSFQNFSQQLNFFLQSALFYIGTIWKKYGLFGIALLTPVIISIPIGTIIASRLVPDKKKVFLYMLISISVWSIIMVSSFELYHAYSIKALQQKVLEP